MIYKTVVDKTEYAIAKNDIIRYTEFLTESIKQFEVILILLKERGIIDELINDRITALIYSVKEHINDINMSCEQLINVVENNARMIESIDRFSFPMDEIDQISRLLSIYT